MNYSVCEQSKIVMSWPQVGAQCTHKLRVLTQFFLDPTFDCCSCLVVHEKEWENLPDFWVCWSVSLCPWTASSIDAAAAVGCVTSVQPCQKGRSLMLPKFLQPSSSISSFPSNLSTLQDISHNMRWRRWHSPFQQSIMFSSSPCIALETIQVQTLGFCTLSKSSGELVLFL